MKTRAEILDAINATIDKSERLYEAAKGRHRSRIEAAFSGAGFQSETATKRAMTKTIPPANRGFRKGSIADQFQTVDPVIDQFHGAPASAVDLDSYFENGSPDAAVSSIDPGAHIGHSVTAHEDNEDFRAALLAQYPLHEQLVSGIARPQVANNVQGLFGQSTTPRLEPTTGKEFLGPGPVDLPTKANLTPLQKLVALFDIYATGGSLKLAKVKLGIR